MNITPICPYCGNFSKQATGAKMYPHRPDLYNLKFYECEPCDAYVGCHGSTDRPLGRLANEELRKAKSATHRMFDAIWKNSYMSRGDAYAWLSRKMKLDSQDTHIGMFNVEQCQQATSLAKEYLHERSDLE